MKTISILTTSYPYGKGEQFLEEEIKYWSHTDRLKVNLVPYLNYGTKRSIPKNIHLDNEFGFKLNYLNLFNLIFCSFFWKEVIYLISSRKINFSNFLRCVKFGILIYSALHSLKKNKLKSDIYYSYWSDFYSYAALLLKNEFSYIKVVTRCHGYDLYEHLYNKNYMPYKRQFIGQYDFIMVLSSTAKNYILENFPIENEKIEISPLGIKIDPNLRLNLNSSNIIKIVTISNCIRLKRIDKVIDALHALSHSENTINFVWHHYGDGVLKKDLEQYAQEKLTSLNILFSFKGQISNLSLQENLLQEQYDLVINSSESEGIPVSLMECMGKYVVPIAPNVGGINHLVNESNGYLLSENCHVDEIIEAIKAYIKADYINKTSKKHQAFQKVFYEYNSQENYNRLISRFTEIGESK